MGANRLVVATGRVAANTSRLPSRRLPDPRLAGDTLVPARHDQQRCPAPAKVRERGYPGGQPTPVRGGPTGAAIARRRLRRLPAAPDAENGLNLQRAQRRWDSGRLLVSRGI